MKERPILFSAPMVRAILNGSKTQTRRVLRHQPELREVPGTFGGRWPMIRKQRGGGYWIMPNALPYLVAECPYGVVGDRLWLRETWQHLDSCAGKKVVYRATDAGPNGESAAGLGWRPSIFMPRWASRITLTITDVRVQRLQEISEEDARAEGVTTTPAWNDPLLSFEHVPEISARENFARLWDSLNAKRAPWESNPWVWAITFERAP